MRETRKQKIDRQRGQAADRAFDPIRAAIDSGELIITPGPAKDSLAQTKRCPECVIEQPYHSYSCSRRYKGWRI